MKKNVVVFHLESLSNEILNQEAKRLSFIRKLMDDSLVFEKFHTSATSSIMAFTDFCYGNDYELDNSYDVDVDLNIQYLEKNLFNIFEENNYNVKGLAYPVTWRDDLNIKKIWNTNSGKYKYHKSEQDFQKDIESFIDDSVANDMPFAMHIWDIRSHLFYTDDKKEMGENFLERRGLGYDCIDETYKDVFTLLSQKGLLENTIIVAYGDHGDELWSHSLNGGFCHGLEPYTTLVHTPCFIYGKEVKAARSEKLVSLVDLKWVILDILNIDEEPRFKYSGKNILKEENSFVFSRNLLANQSSKYNGALRKGYSVTNSNYHLMVGDSGLELYAPIIDPSNSFNLLQFFNLQGDTLIDFNNLGAWHTHFRTIMKQDQIEDIRNNFSSLFVALFEYVERKNDLISREKHYYFDMQAFRRIKMKNYDWNA